VDDHPAVCEALTLLFQHEGWSVTTLPDPRGLAAAAAGADLVLLDMNFTRDTTSGLEGIAAMRALADEAPEVPVILMTAWGTVERAVEAMKLGARDYITKPWDNARLLSACQVQIDLRRRDPALRRRIDRAGVDARGDFAAIVGESEGLVRVLDMVADAAPTEATVLITGPPGTGKELIADAIHRNSARRHKPFVRVHVGALAESLFEREMFGHVRGAFTDAREDRPGRFADADGGTLFLDEIATLKPAQQVKLLRVLQEGEFEPLGSTRTRKVDVRVVAATNADLEAEMAAGRFREDLYYRLQVVEIRLPPLARRPEDVLPCAEHFLRTCAARHRKPIRAFSDEAKAILGRHAWPGNVRELENMIERAVVFCRTDRIEPQDLPLNTSTAPAPRSTLGDLERDAIERALTAHAGNISRAASALGLSRAALYRRIEKYGL
jgi:DNA-binding NtrC family response regulator